jgi:signal transduction histidine kinase
MNRRFWPAALAAISVLVLGSYLVYTQYLVREIRREAAIHSQVYSIVQRGLAGGIEGGPLQALNDLQTQLQNLQIPIIVFDAAGDPVYANNLPFEYDASSPESVAEVREYARQLAQRRPRNRAPVQGGGSMVFGDPPVLNWLRFIPWLQVGAGALLMVIALVIMRADMRAHRERLWSAMARELAHQMGTPLSSLAGWVEVLQLTAEERRAMAETDHIGRVMQADVERLERVSRRFELIGKPPALERVAAADVVDELVSYFRPRLPHLGKGITLRAWIVSCLPFGRIRCSSYGRSRTSSRTRSMRSPAAAAASRSWPCGAVRRPPRARTQIRSIWLSRITVPALRPRCATASSSRG